MTWNRGFLCVLVVLLPFAVTAELIEVPIAPNVEKGQTQEGVVYCWPGSIIQTEGIDLNAEPVVPDLRRQLSREEVSIEEPGPVIDDLNPIYIEGFDPGWVTNWFGPAGGGYDAGGTYHYWLWTERTERSSGGSYAAYCAGDATEVPDPAVDTYPDDMATWIYYGPVDMSMYEGAAVEFDYFIDCEARWDNMFVGISTDGSNYTGNFYSGYAGMWYTDEMITLDFTGPEPTVYFLFKFASDFAVSSGEGAWIDQVRIYGEFDGLPDLQITDVTWNPTNPAPGAAVDIDVAYMNTGPDNAGPFYVDLFLDTDGVAPEIGELGDLYAFIPGVLCPGDFGTHTFTTTYPSDGTRWLYALIDTDEIIEEENEDNNRWGVGKLPVGVATIVTAGPITPYTLPVGGGTISYLATGTQYGGNVVQPAWVTISHEGYGNAVEVFQTNPLPLNAGSSVSATLSHYIPGNAPGGTYNVYVNYGVYPWQPFDTGQASFIKDGPVADGASNLGNLGITTTWTETTPELTGDADDILQLPEEFAMGAAYPNPFNPTTNMMVTLPETAELVVTVYNLQGQEVERLAEGVYNAGQHQLTFDGSGLASGVYLVRTETSLGNSAIQKVMLMK